ncbi:unnamed protein product [Gulo gulo]|uniref:Uncharacterized protein n=1 Tax=Gulo gulo TaxID=48420 RepID=A0A9X9LH33_GULGU|nr:unnamed protein product [Gulo gulo]
MVYYNILPTYHLVNFNSSFLQRESPKTCISVRSPCCTYMKHLTLPK